MKDGDEIANSEDTDNLSEIIFFTDKAQAYKCKTADLDPVKASSLGEFIAAKLGFDDDEKPVMMKALHKYDPDDNIIFIFENGKGVKIPVTAYETKTNRRKLTGAFSDSSPVMSIIYEHEPVDIYMENNIGKAILINSSLIPVKTTRTSAGVILFNMKNDLKVTTVKYGNKVKSDLTSRYRKNKIPASGIAVKENQIKLTGGADD